MGRGGELFGALLGMAASAAVESAAANAAAKADYNNRLKNAMTRIELDIASKEDYILVGGEMRKSAQSTVDDCRRHLDKLQEEAERIMESADGSRTICKIADDFKDDVSLDEFLIKDSNGNILLRLVKCDINGAEEIKAYTDNGEEYDLEKDYMRYGKASTRIRAISDEIGDLKSELREALDTLRGLDQFGM